jgi:hypothetical protein
LLANGDTPSEVADVLGISTSETETLLTRLFAAIGAATRIDAIASAHRRGLLVSEAIAGVVSEPIAGGASRTEAADDKP